MRWLARAVGVDLIDEDVAEAVARAIEAGMTWGAVAEALLGGAGESAQPDDFSPSGCLRAS